MNDMNEMNNTESTIGPLMKAARKFKKFNQSDVATAIGCSQSALSKMEHNLLIPNAPQWFLFSRFTSIPPETIETGIIDRHSQIRLNDDSVSLGYKLPKRYRLNRGQKVREVYPFLVYLEKVIDGDVYKEFMSTLGIDSEFFLDFDNILSFQMIVDLMNLYERISKDSLEEIRGLVRFGQKEVRYWDGFFETGKKIYSLSELFEILGHNQRFFQADFQVKFQEVNGVQTISYIPESHLYHFLKDVGPEVKNFLANYRKATIENLANIILGKEIEARLVPDRSTSPLENHFQIYS